MKKKIYLLMLAVVLLSSGYSYSQQTITIKSDNGLLTYPSKNESTITVKEDNGMLKYEPSNNYAPLRVPDSQPVRVKSVEEIRKERQEDEMRRLQIERMRLENERLRRENSANNSNNNSSDDVDNNRYDFGSYPTSNSSVVSSNNNSTNSNSMNAIDWYNQGVNYRKQGNIYQAIACYQKSLTIAPNFFWANNNIGHNYNEIGENDNAIPYLKRAISIEPQNPFAYSNMGGVYLAKYDYYKTIEYSQKAIDLKDNYNTYLNKYGAVNRFNFSEPYYYIGVAYYKLNNKEKARQYLNIASTYNDEKGRKAKELLQQF